MRATIIGNWKMNGLAADLEEIAAIRDAAASARASAAICPPATLIHRAAALCAGSALAIGGQDCHADASGAHTGDVSAAMLADAGATLVILGHSERRAHHGETDPLIRAKLVAAAHAGLRPILCVGETETERDAGDTLRVLAGQIEGAHAEEVATEALLVAYEPVWAIGTGRVPTRDQIAEAHGEIRARLTALRGAGAADIPLLYGGSMKPENAAAILEVENVNGGLIGGASLRAADFNRILAAA